MRPSCELPHILISDCRATRRARRFDRLRTRSAARRAAAAFASSVSARWHMDSALADARASALRMVLNGRGVRTPRDKCSDLRIGLRSGTRDGVRRGAFSRPVQRAGLESAGDRLIRAASRFFGSAGPVFRLQDTAPPTERSGSGAALNGRNVASLRPTGTRAAPGQRAEMPCATSRQHRNRPPTRPAGRDDEIGSPVSFAPSRCAVARVPSSRRGCAKLEPGTRPLIEPPPYSAARRCEVPANGVRTVLHRTFQCITGRERRDPI